MITEIELQYMLDDINNLTAIDALKMRQTLLLLQRTIDEKLNSRIVHLTIKPRKSGDYVYANWTDDNGSYVEYIGKWQPAAEIDFMLENLTKPTESDFRISDKKAKTLRDAGKWVATYNGGEGINGNIEFQYNYDMYRIAVDAFFERRDLLQNDLAKIAQTDRAAGITKLQRLQEEGYYIKPL